MNAAEEEGLRYIESRYGPAFQLPASMRAAPGFDASPDEGPVELWERVGHHRPRRGSDVERWLKLRREDYPKDSVWWTTLDNLLDDYRLRADTGLDLDAPISEAGG